MKKFWIVIFCLCFSFAPVFANTKEPVTFKKCVDGDTAHLMVKGKDTTVRFLAIDTPEYTKEKEPYGKEASAYVCDLLTNAKKIEIEYDDGSTKEDKYGRLLAWVYVDGLLIQDAIIKEGLGEVAYLYGDYAYTKQLQASEKIAKKEKRNMWSGEEPSQDPWTLIVTYGGSALFIVFILIFVKGKRNKQRMIKRVIKKRK